MEILANAMGMQILREMSNIMSENKSFRLQESINSSMIRLVTLQQDNERGTRALLVMQICLVGMLSFDVLDRLTGDWSVMDADWAADLKSFVEGSPVAWFVISIVMWLLLGYAAVRLIHYLSYRDQGSIVVRLRIQKQMNVEKFRELLKTKATTREDVDNDKLTNVVRIAWEEDDKLAWDGAPPTIQVEYDARNSFLLFITVNYNRRLASKGKARTASEVEKQVMSELYKFEVLQREGAAPEQKRLSIVDM